MQARKRKWDNSPISTVTQLPPELNYKTGLATSIEANTRIVRFTPTIGNGSVNPGGQIIFEFPSTDHYDFAHAVLYLTAATNGNGAGTFNRFGCYMNTIFDRASVLIDGLMVEDLTNYGQLSTILENRFCTLNTMTSIKPSATSTSTLMESFYCRMIGGLLSTATRNALAAGARYALPIHFGSISRCDFPLQHAPESKLQIKFVLDQAANVLESDNANATYTISNVEMHIPCRDINDGGADSMVESKLKSSEGIVFKFPYWWNNQTTQTVSNYSYQISQKTKNMKSIIATFRDPAAQNTLATLNKKLDTQGAGNTKYSLRINSTNFPPDEIDTTDGILPFYQYLTMKNRMGSYTGGDMYSTATFNSDSWSPTANTTGCNYMQCLNLEDFPGLDLISGKDTENVNSQCEFKTTVTNGNYLIDIWVVTDACLRMKKMGNKVMWSVEY